MQFTAIQLVTKISVSDMLLSKSFYEHLLGFKVDERYTINSGGNYQKESYMQLNAPSSHGGAFTLGLYKDIDKPFDAMPQTGTVPSFIVDDVHATLHQFLKQKIVVIPAGGGSGDDQYIIKNTSDEGYVDLFFFFCDPDNNSFVIRQNLPKITHS
jgi:catechol 2,3-dioxygenase-like lactoylglutathione lyase family enzyme